MKFYLKYQNYNGQICIDGQHELEKRLQEMVVWPIKYAYVLDSLHVTDGAQKK
jgi:hypothetical protein